MFDRERALEQFRRGLQEPGHTSAASWGVQTWTEGWDDLDMDAATFWFYALTLPQRLNDDREKASSVDLLRDATLPQLTYQEAQRRLRQFKRAADGLLRHWPIDALAPIALPLAIALGADEAAQIVKDAAPPEAWGPFFAWLTRARPLSSEAVEELIAAAPSDLPADAIASLARGLRSDVATEALSNRLADRGQSDIAFELARHLSPDRLCSWASQNDHVTPAVLEAVVEAVPEDLFTDLGQKALKNVRSEHRREVFRWLTQRPTSGLVPAMLQKWGGADERFVLGWFEAADDSVLRALCETALGRPSKARDAARAVLSRLDRAMIETFARSLDSEVREELSEVLREARKPVPELPRGARPSWMEVVAGRTPRPETWRREIDLRTQSGHRLPAEVTSGIIASLQTARLELTLQGEPRDDYDSALPGLAQVLDPEDSSRFWGSLFADWHAAGLPSDGRWILAAAAFLLPESGIRDLGRKLVHHRKWFGDHGHLVIQALRVSPTRWSKLILADLAMQRRSTLADQVPALLEWAARREGFTRDAYIDRNLPNDDDPFLEELVGRRLEQAMVEGRSWSLQFWEVFRPLMPARAVLWKVVDPYGEELPARFDGEELVDADELPIIVDDDCYLAVMHPAELTDEELSAWTQIFSDYELIQPFGQLSRERFRCQHLSRDGFKTVSGLAFEQARLEPLMRGLGWTEVRSGAHLAAVGLSRVFLRLDVVAEVSYDAPIPAGAKMGRLGPTTFCTTAGDALDPELVHPIAFSEIHRDLMILRRAIS